MHQQSVEREPSRAELLAERPPEAIMRRGGTVAEPGGRGVTAFNGSLDGVGVLPLIQFLGGLGKSGTLHVAGERWSGALGFDHGRLVHAACGDTRGQAALESLVLGLRSGTFAFSEGAAPDQGNLACSPDELAALLASLTASQAAVTAAVPSLAAVPRVATQVPSSHSTDQLVLD